MKLYFLRGIYQGDYDKSKKLLLDSLECSSITDIIGYMNSRICDEIDLNIINAIAINEAYNKNGLKSLEIWLELERNVTRYQIV